MTETTVKDTKIKLNLGCGANHKAGYVNVDKYPPADVVCDLEEQTQCMSLEKMDPVWNFIPWPWNSDSIDEVIMHHSLEHMGATAEGFFHIMKELYRVCDKGALIDIKVPHYNHDDFKNDPTHVRIITPQVLALLSRRNNVAWAAEGTPNTQLATQLGVDFNIEGAQQVIEEEFHGLPDAALRQAIRRYNNVVKEYRIQLKVIK